MSVSRFIPARVSAILIGGSRHYHVPFDGPVTVSSSLRGASTLQLLRFEQAAGLRDRAVGDIWCQSWESVTAFAGPLEAGASRPFCTSSATGTACEGHVSAPTPIHGSMRLTAAEVPWLRGFKPTGAPIRRCSRSVRSPQQHVGVGRKQPFHGHGPVDDPLLEGILEYLLDC
jgi:hypothetical protein